MLVTCVYQLCAIVYYRLTPSVNRVHFKLDGLRQCRYKVFCLRTQPQVTTMGLEPETFGPTPIIMTGPCAQSSL